MCNSVGSLLDCVTALVIRQEQGRGPAEPSRLVGLVEDIPLEEEVPGHGRGRGAPAPGLEEENRKLRQLVADLSLDKRMRQDVLGKEP